MGVKLNDVFYRFFFSTFIQSVFKMTCWYWIILFLSFLPQCTLYFVLTNKIYLNWIEHIPWSDAIPCLNEQEIYNFSSNHPPNVNIRWINIESENSHKMKQWNSHKCVLKFFGRATTYFIYTPYQFSVINSTQFFRDRHQQWIWCHCTSAYL